MARPKGKNETNPIIGDRIRERRRELHLSQQDLADRMNEINAAHGEYSTIGKALISAYENHKYIPFKENQALLSEALDIPIDWIMANDESGIIERLKQIFPENPGMYEELPLYEIAPLPPDIIVANAIQICRCEGQITAENYYDYRKYIIEVIKQATADYLNERNH